MLTKKDSVYKRIPEKQGIRCKKAQSFLFEIV